MRFVWSVCRTIVFAALVGTVIYANAEPEQAAAKGESQKKVSGGNEEKRYQDSTQNPIEKTQFVLLTENQFKEIFQSAGEKNVSGQLTKDKGDSPKWTEVWSAWASVGSTLLALLALAVTFVIALRQIKLSRSIADQQEKLARDINSEQKKAMTFRLYEQFIGPEFSEDLRTHAWNARNIWSYQKNGKQVKGIGDLSKADLQIGDYTFSEYLEGVWAGSIHERIDPFPLPLNIKRVVAVGRIIDYFTLINRMMERELLDNDLVLELFREPWIWYGDFLLAFAERVEELVRKPGEFPFQSKAGAAFIADLRNLNRIIFPDNSN